MSTTTRADLPDMTADEFMVWVMQQPSNEKYELSNGRILAMSPERWGHGEVKATILVNLTIAVREAGLPCRILGDSMAVRIDNKTIFEPDVLVRCGPRPSFDTLEINDPIIIVEVLSPSTASRDRSVKLTGYFRLPSLRHYLLVSADERRIVHHRRVSDTEFATTIVGTDPIRLDPPGIVLAGVFD
jgi:Uma2 family endonuclease